MSRNKSVESWFEREDGAEVLAVLHYSYTPYQASTYWEPAVGGVEVDWLEIDGARVDDRRPEFDDLVCNLIQRAHEEERNRGYDD